MLFIDDHDVHAYLARSCSDGLYTSPRTIKNSLLVKCIRNGFVYKIVYICVFDVHISRLLCAPFCLEFTL